MPKLHLFGWKPDRPDQRDKYYGEHLKPKARVIPTRVDLRQWTSKVEDQGEVGSCTANAVVGAMEYNEIKNGGSFVDLSRLFVYYNSRVIEDTVDEDMGAYIRDAVKSASRYGACTEKKWPYKVPKWASKPSKSCYADGAKRSVSLYVRVGTFDDIINVLADGYPVVFGATLYESFTSPEVAKSGIVPLPKLNERTIGGHAMLIVGYDKDQQNFIIRNSWGTGWGQDGHCVMPFKYFENIGDLVDDLWIIKL